MAFEATYPGECSMGDEIEIGDVVTYVADELTHLECVRTMEPEELAEL